MGRGGMDAVNFAVVTSSAVGSSQCSRECRLLQRCIELNISHNYVHKCSDETDIQRAGTEIKTRNKNGELTRNARCNLF
jgi:hypothetical protein